MSTTNEINKKLDPQQKSSDKLDPNVLLGLSFSLQDIVSEQIRQKFLSVVDSGNVTEIMEWCGQQKHSSSWLCLAAIHVPAIADRMEKLHLLDNKTPFLSASSVNIYHGASSTSVVDTSPGHQLSEKSK